MSDVATDTRWRNGWRELAKQHGLKSCWSTPIVSLTGKALGTFALYYNEPRSPTVEHQSLIERFTHIASIAIERSQSDAALKQSEARKTAILNSALDWHPAPAAAIVHGLASQHYGTKAQIRPLSE